MPEYTVDDLRRAYHAGHDAGRVSTMLTNIVINAGISRDACDAATISVRDKQMADIENVIQKRKDMGY